MLTPSMQRASRFTLFLAYAALITVSTGARGNSVGTMPDNPPAPTQTMGDTYAEGTEVSSYVTDAMITGKVKAELFRDPDLISYEIRVETDNGRVMLSGQVDTQAEVDRAGDLALGIKEVRVVINYICVRGSQ
ncbi:BON domain-containing protein [Chromobacterium alticapitis]|uniref:BON domain-containing protein n=1 Tax=Chromobacterium alticapitis TaxID=2073169 RepID=A0A2S5DBG0_9NEIS|nr:BON domain-containing protein [Chromobacterium alticapitis]POZ60378.1 BON domain-containing protein [Chromobacterium alticapitis]